MEELEETRRQREELETLAKEGLGPRVDPPLSGAGGRAAARGGHGL